jgi:hypothetical protein
MKRIQSKFYILQQHIFIAIFLMVTSTAFSLDPDGTRFYWMEDWSSGSDQDFLEKFREDNLQYWEHSAARMDAYTVRRGSAVALAQARSANNQLWQAFKSKIPSTVWVAGMNSGLMNRSWEFDNRSEFINRFSGDLGIIDVARDAGFNKIVMFLQSPLSKGQAWTFDPAQGGASLEQRVQDCVDYAKYIMEHKVSGIDVSFALIDAFPQKRNLPVTHWRQAFKNLVEAFIELEYDFDGFLFDMKSSYVANNTHHLTNECIYIHSLAEELSYPLFAGWYTWSSWQLSDEIAHRDVTAAMNAIKNHPDKDEVKHIWISGNGENDYVPDYIDGPPVTRQERFNQIFCILENLEPNPTKPGDPIIGPVNTAEIPPSDIRNFNVTIDAIDQITLKWGNVYREDFFKVLRIESPFDSNDTTQVATVDKDSTSYIDKSVTVNQPYKYIIAAVNDFGVTYSDAKEIIITDYAPAAASDITFDTSSCYQIGIQWKDNADNENSYRLIRKQLNNPEDSVVVSLKSGTESYMDKSIQTGSMYQYNLVAVNHVGKTSSGWIDVPDSECTAAPLTPTNLTASLIMCRKATIQWNNQAINADSTELQIKIMNGDWVAHTLYRDKSDYQVILVEDTIYNIRARAINSFKQSQWSEEITLSTESCDCDRSTYGNDGKLWEVNQIIEAEYFDWCMNGVSGQGITYFEPNPEHLVGDRTIRPDELINLFVTTVDGVSWIRTGAVEEGEYWEYSVRIEEADSFYVVARVASIFDDRLINIYVDDNHVTTLSYQSKPSWRDYHEVTSENFWLDQGTKIFRVKSVTGGTDMDWFKIVPLNTTNIAKKQVTKDLTIYPNPAHNSFTIDNPENNIMVKIFTVNGKLIYYKQDIKDSIHVVSTNNIPKGMYIVKAIGMNQTYTSRLVIQ